MKINNDRFDALEKDGYKKKTWIMTLSAIGGAAVGLIGKIGFVKLLTFLK